MHSWKLVSVLPAFVLIAAACLAEDLRVTSVQVTGVGEAETRVVHRRMRMRAGDTFSESALQDDYLAILSLAFVRSATVSRIETDEGVEIIYEIVPREAIREIRFEGNRRFRDKRIERVGELDELRHYDLARLNRARDLILEEYRSKGFLLAQVDFRSEPDGVIVFEIDEGRRTRVAEVQFRGNESISDRVLKRQIDTRTRRYLLFAYRLDHEVLENDVLSLRDYYRDQGYLDARVGVSFDVDERLGRNITVEFQIDEGELYTVSGVDIYGNDVLSTAQLTSRLEMTVGKPFSPSGLQRDISAMRDAYGSIGHIDASATPVTTIEEEEPRVYVSYRVEEGSPIYVHEVAIIGNDKTRDNVIRRDLEFAPGELFNTEAIRRSHRNLERLGYFSRVDIATERTDHPDRRDAIVEVEEMATGQLLLGMAYSSDIGITGQITFRQRNFDYARPPTSWRDLAEGRAWVGAGQIFELDIMPGTRFTRFAVSYKDPRVNDSPYSLGLSAQRWHRPRETYEERRTSGTVSVGRQFGLDYFWEVAATAGAVKISNIELRDRTGDGLITPADMPDYLGRVKGTNQVNLLGFTIGRDTRDSFLMPTEGHRMSGMVETSSDAIASDFDFLRFLLEGRWYRTLARDELDRPHVINWRGRVGVMVPKDGRVDSPIFERFFVGGAADMRGFGFRGLGPHDFDEPLGGEFMTVGGLQYEFPLAGDNFRGVLFWDSGMLVDDPGDARMDLVRHSLGFGVRLYIPPPLNIPLALDFGFPVVEKDEDQTQVFSLGFGRAI